MNCCHQQQSWFDASRNNNPELINKLGAHCITLREDRDVPDQYIFHDFTAMMNAAYFGHPRVLELLITDEYRELLEHPVCIPIMSFKETLVRQFYIPADFSPFYLSLLSQSTNCLRILCVTYLTQESVDLLSFDPPYDVLSLLVISGSQAVLQVVTEQFQRFYQFIFPLLSSAHLRLAVALGNKEFVQLVLKMANSTLLCRVAVKAVKQYNARIGYADTPAPQEMLADDGTYDECRQLLIGYMLGERLFPVPQYMGGPLPQPRFTIKRYAQPAQKRGSLNLQVLYQYQAQYQQKEQIFRVYSCGDLHITPHMHRTGSGFFNVDGQTCDVTDIDGDQYHQTIAMISQADYLGVDGEIVGAQVALTLAYGQLAAPQSRRMSIAIMTPDVRLTAEQWRKSVELPRDGPDSVYEDSCCEAIPPAAVGRLLL